MDGINWRVINEDQRSNFIQFALQCPIPFQGKIGEVHHPKTTKQIRYAHSLCNALAQGEHVHPEIAKRDAKAAFGVIVVHNSVVTGERTARLVSFADYTKEQLTAFCTAMEVHLSEKGYPFIASES